MAVIFIDGFDKYGPAGLIYTNNNGSFSSAASSGTSIVALLQSGEWTGASVTMNGAGTATMAVVSPLSSTGQALQFTAGSTSGTSIVQIYKTLPTNYATIIGGIRFRPDVLGPTTGLVFQDGTNAQCSIKINQTTGTFSVLSGSLSGTVLATSTTSVTATSIHYLEWQIGFGTTGVGTYQVWLDGVSILNGTGNTRAGSTNNYCNLVTISTSSSSTSSAQVTIDDFYLFDTTGSTNNAPLLSNPRIETQYPISDAQTQFANGALVLGNAYSATAATNAPGANKLFLRKITPSASCTINSISCIPAASSSTANYKPAIYSDSAGSPGSLLSTGSAVTGTVAATVLTGPLTTPQSLTAGTPYWIGFITDTSVVLQEQDATTTGVSVTATYTSGAPSSPTGFTTGLTSWVIWGNATGASTNWETQNDNPALAGLTYAWSGTVGNEDLYNFPALSVNPSAVYTMAVKCYGAKTDTGARTISLHTKSSSNDGTGSNPGIIPATSYTWLTSYFDTDPNTGVAWTGIGVNGATSGPGIAS